MSVIMLILSLVVSVDVFWVLRQPGWTLAGDADCGILEHTHDEVCYQTAVVDENPITELVCEYQEHVHSIECYSDKAADVESMLDWQAMFAAYPYTGDLRQDLVGIAKTQVGYTESTLNFQVGDDGVRRGYTRYGAWYGTPYREWSTVFVSFCLNYAGADPAEVPGNTGAAAMAELWRQRGKYASLGEYTPVSGDVVFFHDNTTGIVAEIQLASFCVIRGDVDGAVCSEVISLTDASIAGWGSTVGTVAKEEVAEGEAEGKVPMGNIPTGDNPTGDIPAGDVPTGVLPEGEISKEEALQGESLKEEVSEEALLDISNGPAVFIFENGESPGQPQMQRFALRNTRTITDLLPYLEANGGGYFFTLLDFDNHELPKDDAGNYVVQAEQDYKLTISFTSPKGFLPGTYQYQIPNGLLVDGGEGTFVLKDGTNVGNWVVTDEGLITLVFNENMNSRSDITISATLGIHFPEQEDPIDFDGKITVTIEKPSQEVLKTQIYKWGSQGNESHGPDFDPTKIYWTVYIVPHEGSQVPGSTFTDYVLSGEYLGEHHYTESDIAGGITFGVSEYDPVTGAAINWHSWHVPGDDPNLTWTEEGWTYVMPQTAVCEWCGEITLGNKGWDYYMEYTSTPKPSYVSGALGYMNHVNVDQQDAEGWAEFTHGEILAEIIKHGAFVADAQGGAFLWEFQAIIPGMKEGQKAEYNWYVMDYMSIRNSEDVHVTYVQNDADKVTVTASYNGGTITVPNIRDATANDPFAWENNWSVNRGDGVYYGRQLSLLCRCHCNAENCQFWNGHSCESAYWYQAEDGYWYTNGFCLCWGETDNTVFTFTYRTDDLTTVESYGGMNNYLRNEAVLHNMIILPNGSLGGVQIADSHASVPIPGLFKKALTHDFDGYTANYKITVNEAKLSLTNGSPLNIRDEMTQTLAYISGSLVITSEDANGNTVTLRQGEDYTVNYDGTGNQTDENGKPVHVLDIVILHPQPVMYLLDYDTTLIIPAGTTQAIKYTNSANVTLWGESISGTTSEKVYADINIAAKSYKVEMFKSCALTGEPLGGATFGLYNEQGGLITTEVTDANGELYYQTNIVEGIILREHVLYYMQELKAPPGYQLDDRKYWFCFCDEESDSCETCTEVMEGTGGTRIPFEQVGKVHIVNERINYDLPSTGGPGSTPIILVGVILVAAPLVYGFFRRRKQERRGVT